jgi:hypothetical protein
MPMQKEVTPESGYKAAGSTGTDFTPTMTSKAKKSGKPDNGGNTSGPHTKVYPTSVSGMKNANFTTDADMAPIKNLGKSGKY